MSRVFLVRHAHAGDRAKWSGDDGRRPLSEKGRRQAEGLVELLRGQPVARILSSPSLRCVQTVEPLARDRGLSVESVAELLEGADPDDALSRLERAAGEEAGAVVASTHGDIIPGILDTLRSAGAAFAGAMAWPKASTWVLEGDADGDGFARARYLPPP